MRQKLGVVGILLLTLTACGSEGGGGGTLKSDVEPTNGNTTNNGDTNTSTNDDVLTVPRFSAAQHVYLPLIEDLGWAYNIGSEQFSLTAQVYEESQNQFSLTSEVEVSSDQTSSLTEVLTSSSDAVNLVRINAENMTVPVEGYQVTLNSLTFQNDQTLTLIGDSLSNGELPVTLNVDITYGFFSIRNSAINLPATATVTNEETTIAIDGWGKMPALRVAADLRISGDVSVLTQTVPIDVRIVETASYVKGIGPLERSLAFYLGESSDAFATVEMSFAGLVGLPEPIVYTLDQVTAVAPSRTDVRVSDGLSSFTTLLPSQYELLNQDELAESGWATVASTTDETAYVVEVVAPESLPEESIAEVLYLTLDDGETELPVNVTLSVEE